MCAVFGGQTSDHAVADLLRTALGRRADELPPSVLRSADPFEVLRFGGLLGPNGLDAIEARLTQAERRAVSTAPATPGAEGAAVVRRNERVRLAHIRHRSVLPNLSLWDQGAASGGARHPTSPIVGAASGQHDE